MNRWRVGEDMGNKEMDRCPLTGGGGASGGRSRELTTFSMRSHRLLEIEVVDPW
jgi:hypothetical protein